MIQNKKMISFWKLLGEQKILIPIIQRDYAQGRQNKESLRKRFLSDLKKSLEDNTILTLDFVYGTIDNNDSMSPLDGQQRLTTLWLLHWYIAYKTGHLNDQETSGRLKRFSYETRVSSRDFCEKLCDLKMPENIQDHSLLKHIKGQTWFLNLWEQDPTIQAMLRMLCGEENRADDNIDAIFGKLEKELLETDWEKLTGSTCPIQFYHLIIGTKELPLSDDLYIKMNARGKKLTSFENFKADLINWIKSHVDEKESLRYASLIDNSWTDIFWNVTGRETTHVVDEVFFTFINRYFYNLAIREKNEDGYVIKDKKASENKAYQYFSNDNTISYESFDIYKDYLNEEILQKITKIFENLKNLIDHNENVNELFTYEWAEDFRFIPEYKQSDGQKMAYTLDSNENRIYDTTGINQQERVVFYAICKYLEQNTSTNDEDNSLAHWMRFVWNIVSEYDGNRPTIRSVGAVQNTMGIIDRVENPHAVYRSLNTNTINTTGNTSIDKRFVEEIEKIQEIQNTNRSSDEPNEEEIIKAEKQYFFRGAIGFLFKKQDGEGKTVLDWSDFKQKVGNLDQLFQNNDINAQTSPKLNTIGMMIIHLNDDDLSKIFNNFYLSNDDSNLQNLLINYPGKMHEFLMISPIKDPISHLQNDLKHIAEKFPYNNYWIHPNWIHNIDILSNYIYRSGDYEDNSYLIGEKAHIMYEERIQILQQCTDVTIKKDENQFIRPYLDFTYKDTLFRWQSNDWIDMYDKKGNNLWKMHLHMQFKGSKANSFIDPQTLNSQLERCLNDYNKKREHNEPESDS